MAATAINLTKDKSWLKQQLAKFANPGPRQKQASVYPCGLSDHPVTRTYDPIKDFEGTLDSITSPTAFKPLQTSSHKQTNEHKSTSAHMAQTTLAIQNHQKYTIYQQNKTSWAYKI